MIAITGFGHRPHQRGKGIFSFRNISNSPGAMLGGYSHDTSRHTVGCLYLLVTQMESFNPHLLMAQIASGFKTKARASGNRGIFAI